MLKKGIFQKVFIILVGFIFLYPILLILINSFKPYSVMVSNFIGLPQRISFDKYIETWVNMNFNLLFFNTIVYTVIVVAIVVITASMAGYKLAREKTVLGRLTAFIFVLPLMLPFQSIMITVSKLAKTTGLIGNRTGYIIIMSGLLIPLATFIINGFVSNIPMELEECARIDGASTLTLFRKVVFPMLNPAIITVVIIDAITVWNDFTIQLIILGGKKDFYNIQNSLYAEFSNQATDWEHALPGLMISLTPVIIFFIFMQSRIVDGIASGAVKG